jgi:hypothetical protein
MQSIRKFVGRGTFALALAALLALAVSVQAGQAAKSTRVSNNAALANLSQPRAHELTSAQPPHEASVAPSPQCTDAVNALKAALVSDRSEDSLEAANAAGDTETGAELTEDNNEKAALKPLVTAVESACGGELHEVLAPPVPKTPACQSALTALKNAFVADRAEDQAELSNGTEGTAADQTEDQNEFAAKAKLWADVRTACAGSFSAFSWTWGGTDPWHHR